MVGIIIALIAVGMLAMTPFMPKIMPKIGGPAKTLGLGVVLFLLTRFVTALLPLFSGALLVLIAWVLMILQGAVYAFTEVGGLSWVLMAAPPGQKTGAMSVLVMSRSVGMVVGPPLGGILFDFFGFSWTCIIGGLLLVAPLLNSYDVFNAPIVQREPPPSRGNILNLTKVRLVGIISCAGIAGTYSFVPYLQPYFEAHYGIGKAVYGLITMLSIVGLMVGSGVCGCTPRQIRAPAPRPSAAPGQRVLRPCVREAPCQLTGYRGVEAPRDRAHRACSALVPSNSLRALRASQPSRRSWGPRTL